MYDSATAIYSDATALKAKTGLMPADAKWLCCQRQKFPSNYTVAGSQIDRSVSLCARGWKATASLELGSVIRG